MRMEPLRRRAQVRRDRIMTVRIGAFEIAKRGVDRWDWRDPYHFLIALSWPSFVAAFLAAEIVLNALFGLLYLLVPGCIANLPPGSALLAFSFSLETLATVGYGVMAPATAYGHAVSAVEIVLGVLFTAIVTGLIFVRFARPRAVVLNARTMVVTRHDGQPVLMARIGNGRMSPLVDAHARMSALVSVYTSEGRLFRSAVHLPLLRDRIPTFALTWTLIHPIDAASPLFGLSEADLRRVVVRLYLTVDALDPVLAARVQHIVDWGPDQVQFGRRYADAVSVDAHGRTIADLRLISDVVPDDVDAEADLSYEDAAELPEMPAD